MISGKKKIALIISALLMFALVGCTNDNNLPIEIESPDEPVQIETIDNNDESVDEDPEPASEYGKMTMLYGTYPAYVYEFSVFSEEEYPRGEWSVNQLIEKYGSPEECYGYYAKVYGIYEMIYMSVKCENMIISFRGSEAGYFSFYEESLEAGRNYPLNNQDKDVMNELSSVTVSGPDATLPFGLKIGQSTKTQVVDSYAEVTPDFEYNEKFNNDSFGFLYAFLDDDGELTGISKSINGNDDLPGVVNYIFDQNDLLTSVEVLWWRGD